MKKILIIENHYDTSEILGIIVKDLGYEIVSSYGDISLNDIMLISPDVILLDYWLGHILGSDLCLEIKSNPITRHIPVIFLSVSPNIAEIAKQSGADHYISKPFDIDELARIVNSYTAII